MKIKFLFAVILFASCTKEVVEPVAPPTTQINQTTNTTVVNDVTTISGITMKYGVDASSHGILYYDSNIIISPSDNLTATKPFHLIKKDNKWVVESINTTGLMDNVRNVYKVSDGAYVWANASDEGPKNIGSLFLSKTTSTGSIEWKELSPTKGFYHYAAAGDIDNDGTSEIFSYIGAETESPESFNIFKQDGTIIPNTLPTITEFEDAVGFVRRDKNPSQKLNSFSFGSMAVANVDPSTPEPELILTTTKALMSEYYSFIYLNYDRNSKKFKITKVIKSAGLIKDRNLGVADVRTGDFNNDNVIDIAVSMGNHLTKDYSGIQIWLNDGKGNMTPDKSELYGSEFGNLIYFSNFEVGKFRNNDCIFLHFDRTRYGQIGDNTVMQTTDGLLELKNYLLVNDGSAGSFKHLDKLTMPAQIPTVVKGHFENNGLRLLGFKDQTKEQFDITDIKIQ